MLPVASSMGASLNLNCHVQVSDLGLAYIVPGSTTLSEDCMLPVRWTAPEVLLQGECSEVRVHLSAAAAAPKLCPQTYVPYYKRQRGEMYYS